MKVEGVEWNYECDIVKFLIGFIIFLLVMRNVGCERRGSLFFCKLMYIIVDDCFFFFFI